MTKVKESDYARIGDVTYEELLAYSESESVKSKKRNLIEVFVEYTYNKFELSQYILKSEIVDAIFLQQDEKMLRYSVFIKRKYLESEESVVEDVKKIIGME